jgi:hypothetical protein
MPDQAGQTALYRPAAVTVHDDSDMLGQPREIHACLSRFNNCKRLFASVSL